MRKKILTVLMLVLSAAFTVLPACNGGAGKTGNPSNDTPPVKEHECGSVCVYCGKCKSDCAETVCAEKCECEPVTVEHTTSAILTGTVWETSVHRYKTNKEGPKIAIVGGIHGDEIAGWTAGLDLVEKFNAQTVGIRGEILLIPQANIQADKLKERYQGRSNSKNGIGTYNGIKYSDLNRSFPDGRVSNAQTTTIKISDAICSVIEEFAADYIIDLHESLHSWTMQDSTTTSLGDTLIFKNNALFMEDLIYYYNKVYRPESETAFASNPTSVKGSFNYHFSNLFPESVVFTIETNRQNLSGADTAPLTRRVRQQLNIIEAMLDMAWQRVDLTDIL